MRNEQKIALQNFQMNSHPAMQGCCYFEKFDFDQNRFVTQHKQMRWMSAKTILN